MRPLFLAICTILFLSACERPPEIQSFNGYAQGTSYSVKYWTTEKTTDKHALKYAVDTELARIDKLMSNYRDDSNIALFNQNKVANIPILLDSEILAVLDIAGKAHQKSQGCYDPTIGGLFRIWGFSEDKLQIPDAGQISETLSTIGFADKLTRDAQTLIKQHPETTVDLSAIGQGYAVAQIAKILEKNGINNYLSEIGGEMLVAGTKPEQEMWKVGVERPIPNSQKINEVITLTGKQATAIMTSGTYRHYFDANGERYSHILDPRSGKPVTHNSVAVTVLLPDATYADAWSTALLCLGSEAGLAVANSNNIPAVFYDINTNETLQRLESDSVKKQLNNWQIEPH